MFAVFAPAYAGPSEIVRSLKNSWLVTACLANVAMPLNAVIDSASSPRTPLAIGLPKRSKYAFALVMVFALPSVRRSLIRPSTM